MSTAETDREHRGRIVRETWTAWAAEQDDPKPSWLTPWAELDAGQREVDMRIGDALAADSDARASLVEGGQFLTIAPVHLKISGTICLEITNQK